MYADEKQVSIRTYRTYHTNINSLLLRRECRVMLNMIVVYCARILMQISAFSKSHSCLSNRLLGWSLTECMKAFMNGTYTNVCLQDYTFV